MPETLSAWLSLLFRWLFSPHIFEVAFVLMTGVGVAMALANDPRDIARARWFFGAAAVFLVGRIGQWLVTTSEAWAPKPLVAFLLFGMIGACGIFVYQWVHSKLHDLAPRRYIYLVPASGRIVQWLIKTNEALAPRALVAFLLFGMIGACGILVYQSVGSRLPDSASSPYIYLVPTSELIDAERRAFFIRGAGQGSMKNVDITLLDEKSRQRMPPQHYSDLDASIETLGYFWWSPLTPWDESYAITITSDLRPIVTQHITLRSEGRLLRRFAEVRRAEKSTPSLVCRDSLTPTGVSFQHSDCGDWFSLPMHAMETLDPRPFNLQLYPGSLQVLRNEDCPL